MSDLDRFEQRIHAHWRKVYRAAKEQPDTYPVARSIASALTSVIKHGGGLPGAREISTCLRENLAEDYAPQLFHVAEDDYPWNGPAKLGNELDYIISAHGYTETGKILKRSAERAFECCRGQNLSGNEWKRFSLFEKLLASAA